MRVEFRNIHKHFGAVHANDDVSFAVEAGSIHGLLGENGAGKSTLVKVLTGFISRDAGDILFDGKPVRVVTTKAFAVAWLLSPSAAIDNPRIRRSSSCLSVPYPRIHSSKARGHRFVEDL